VEVVPEALAAATPTLREVAARVGVSYASVRAWRTGTRMPTAKGCRRLAAALRKQADKLHKMADHVEANGTGRRRGRDVQLELSDGFIANFL
jgi:transcriptional regulator with XRE-family HTH domain